jgi:hypothetical protein
MTAEVKRMNADQVLHYLDQQKQAIQVLIEQLDEVQVAFNAQFDEFKAEHDVTLDRLTDQVLDELRAGTAGRMDAAGPELRRAIDERLPEERREIDERRQKVREEYLPRRQQAAAGILTTAQAELAELRTLNPQLDEREEAFKLQKAELEARLAELNEEIRQQSRGLGVMLHFVAITKADRERQRILGKLEAISDSLYSLRRIWEGERQKVEKSQASFQEQWQLESMAVARLQSELDQLDDEPRREDLALRRAIRYVLDEVKEPPSRTDPDSASSSGQGLEAGLREMVTLNIQTDAYHAGLASVGGMIGLSGGIHSGLEAIGRSIEGLKREQQMHKAYLKPLSFTMPDRVETFHEQWPALAQQFADEETTSGQPVDFVTAVQPLLDGPLSEANIKAMFDDLGNMIERATARW